MQILDIPVPQIVRGMDIPDVPQQPIVPEIPEVQVLERAALVLGPQMVEPLVDVPKIGLQERIQQHTVETPVVTLVAQDHTEAHKNESAVLYSQRAKLYRWRDRENDESYRPFRGRGGWSFMRNLTQQLHGPRHSLGDMRALQPLPSFNALVVLDCSDDRHGLTSIVNQVDRSSLSGFRRKC